VSVGSACKPHCPASTSLDHPVRPSVPLGGDALRWPPQHGNSCCCWHLYGAASGHVHEPAMKVVDAASSCAGSVQRAAPSQRWPRHGGAARWPWGAALPLVSPAPRPARLGQVPQALPWPLAWPAAHLHAPLASCRCAMQSRNLVVTGGKRECMHAAVCQPHCRHVITR
jgi:hypothetical protein